MRRISEDTRDDIVALVDGGLSSRQVEARLGVSYATVNRVRAQARPHVQKNRAGRPAKLTPTDKRWLVRTVTSGEADTAPQLARQLKDITNVECSPQTVRNALKEAGLSGVVKKKRPRLTLDHRKKRRAFVQRYQDWTREDWKRVVWSDETKINRFGPDGRVWAWKRRGEPLSDRLVSPTVKHGGGGVMVWGCMSAQGVGHACRIDGGLDAELYTHILDDELLGTLSYHGLGKDEIIFQQDNAPAHTAKATSEWFARHEIEVLEWPPQSPDLNPIEHLWAHLKRQLAAYPTEPKSQHELWKRVEAEWEKIPARVCVNLIESMPARVAAVAKAKGGYTKY
jgi:transposase